MDEETGWYYYGARYYNPRTSIWLSVDPLAEKYPSVSPYNYCLQSPIKFIDPDGRDPISGIVEALSSFAISVGLDFVSGYLFEGKSAKRAFQDVSWLSATADAGITYGISIFTPAGTGTAVKIAKLAKSKPGKVVIDIVKNLTTTIISEYESGKYNDANGEFDFSKIDLTTSFFKSLINVLIDKQMGAKAENLLNDISELVGKKRARILRKYHRRARLKNGKLDPVYSDEKKLELVNKEIAQKTMDYTQEKLKIEASKKAVDKAQQEQDK